MAPDPPAGTRVIQVADNGIGFQQKYAEKIFDVFQRLHTAEEFEGPASAWPSAEKCGKARLDHPGPLRAREGAVFEMNCRSVRRRPGRLKEPDIGGRSAFRPGDDALFHVKNTQENPAGCKMPPYKKSKDREWSWVKRS